MTLVCMICGAAAVIEGVNLQPCVCGSLLFKSQVWQSQVFLATEVMARGSKACDDGGRVTIRGGAVPIYCRKCGAEANASGLVFRRCDCGSTEFIKTPDFSQTPMPFAGSSHALPALQSGLDEGPVLPRPSPDAPIDIERVKRRLWLTKTDRAILRAARISAWADDEIESFFV